MLLFLAPLLGLPWTCSNIIQTDLRTEFGSISCFTEFSRRLVLRMYHPVCQQKAFNTTQYKVEKKSRILVVTQIFRHNPEKALLKSAMYVRDEEDVDFLRANHVRIGPNTQSRVCLIL